jgi:lysozyme
MTMLYGDDLSVYQDAIPGGQDFHILKATEGTSYVDGNFAGWWAQLAGKLRGAYHFAHPGNDPIVEADHFVSVVGPHLAPGDVVVLDHESLSVTRRSVLGARALARIDRRITELGIDRATWAQQWCVRVHAKLDRAPVVYTFLSFAESGFCAELGNYPLWIADPSNSATHPRVPAPWSTWAFHQYSTAAGIDHDVFNGDATAFRALGGQTPTPLPQEDDVISGQLHFGDDGKCPLGWPAGKFTAIGFAADNTFSTADGTVKAALPCQLRVAVRHDDGSWQVQTVTVGNAAGKSNLKTVVHFTNAATVNGCSITRADNSTTTISVDAS